MYSIRNLTHTVCAVRICAVNAVRSLYRLGGVNAYNDNDANRSLPATLSLLALEKNRRGGGETARLRGRQGCSQDKDSRSQLARTQGGSTDRHAQSWLRQLTGALIYLFVSGARAGGQVQAQVQYVFGQWQNYRFDMWSDDRQSGRSCR